MFRSARRHKWAQAMILVDARNPRCTFSQCPTVSIYGVTGCRCHGDAASRTYSYSKNYIIIAGTYHKAKSSRSAMLKQCSLQASMARPLFTSPFAISS